MICGGCRFPSLGSLYSESSSSILGLPAVSRYCSGSMESQHGGRVQELGGLEFNISRQCTPSFRPSRSSTRASSRKSKLLLVSLIFPNEPKIILHHPQVYECDVEKDSRQKLGLNLFILNRNNEDKIETLFFSEQQGLIR